MNRTGPARRAHGARAQAFQSGFAMVCSDLAMYLLIRHSYYPSAIQSSSRAPAAQREITDKMRAALAAVSETANLRMSEQTVGVVSTPGDQTYRSGVPTCNGLLASHTTAEVAEKMHDPGQHNESMSECMNSVPRLGYYNP